MALKAGLPAIRAKWLWDWQERGTIKTVPLLGTRVLVVAENSRPFKTWHEFANGDVLKNATRYWMGEGVLCVPRWDPLDIHYDPIYDSGVKTLGLEELKEQGMYRLNGKLLVLIYQHVEGALHFQRQQWHIRLERYAAELKEIRSFLNEIEDHALRKVFLEEAPAEVAELGVLARRLRRRRQEIHQILVHIAPRERAAEILVNALWRELQLSQRGIQGVLSSKSMEELFTGLLTRKEGLRAYLVKIYLNLNQIKVRPIVRPLKLVQHYLRGGLGALDVGEIEMFRHQLESAIENLEKAQKSLQHPKEKIEVMPTAIQQILGYS